MVWDRVGDAVRGGRRAGAEAAVPRLADGRGERAGSPPPAPARRAVWSRQRRLRGSTPNSCRPGALRDPAGRRRRRLLGCPRSRPGPLRPVGWRGAAPGSVAAASGRAASEDPERRRRCPGAAAPAGAGLCPALPCGRSLSPPGPLPGSAARGHRRLPTQPAGGFLPRAFPRGLLASRPVHVALLFVTVGFARVCCLPVCPFHFSHANTPQRTAAREQPGHRRQPVWGIAFLVLNLSACYLFTDFKNRLVIARIAYILSVVLITNHLLHQMI